MIVGIYRDNGKEDGNYYSVQGVRFTNDLPQPQKYVEYLALGLLEGLRGYFWFPGTL